MTIQQCRRLLSSWEWSSWTFFEYNCLPIIRVDVHARHLQSKIRYSRWFTSPPLCIPKNPPFGVAMHNFPRVEPLERSSIDISNATFTSLNIEPAIGIFGLAELPLLGSLAQIAASVL